MKTSVNIKYDSTNLMLIKDYYATDKHFELLNEVITNSDINSYVAYGPYGSGKSFVSTIISNLLAKEYSKKNISEILLKFKPFSKNLKRDIEKHTDSNIRFIPVYLNGYEGEFSYAIIKNLEKSLKKHNINVKFPSKFNSVFDIISRWREKYPKVFQSFLDLLSEKNLEYNQFLSQIENFDEDALHIFENIHSELTAGSTLNHYDSISLIENLQTVIDELTSLDLGLFIVYDEFGRYLQSVSNEQVNQLMQLMQDLAELANNGSENLKLLFITHRPISYYFNFLRDEFRLEFSKVEKRFLTFEIRSDEITFLKIAHSFIGENFLPPKKDLTQNNKLTKFDLFSEFSSQLDFDPMLELYPLHPLSLYLLPKVSSVFGQNERTLFTFLEDKSESGLRGFVEKYRNQIYYADKLVDFFVDGLDETFLIDYPVYRIYKKNLPKISKLVGKKDSQSATRIYKLLLILDLTRGSGLEKINTEFLEYALDIQLPLLTEILNTLSKYSLLRFNGISEEWQLFESSGADINALIDKEISINKSEDLKILNRFTDKNPHKVIYANEYNARFQMTRYAAVQFSTKSLSPFISAIDQADYNIIIDLSDSSYEINGIDEIFSYSINFLDVKTLIVRLEAVESMLAKIELITKYPRLDIELEYEKNLINYQLNQIYSQIFESIFKSKKTISLKLTDIFNRTFNKTFVINNDQINAYKISSVQVNALKQVLDRVLDKFDLSISEYFNGTKPADLIYFSTIDTFIFRAEQSDNYLSLKSDLIEYIVSKPNGDLNDLIDIATSPPYGLRPYVALVLVMISIIEQWKDVLLFSEGNFIPVIQAKDLIDAYIEKNFKIQYSFSHYDNTNRELLEGLEKLFDDTSDNIKDKSISVKVCSSMYNWYLNLPVITQQMYDLSFSEVKLLKIISKSRINPQESLDDIIATFNDLSVVSNLKFSIENHFVSFQDKLISNFFLRYGVTDKQEWAKKQSKIHQKSNRLVSSVLANENLIEVYSTQIENLDINKWTLSSFKYLEKEMELDYNRLEKNVKYSTIVINGVEKFVQDTNLSIKAENTYKNLENTIVATRKYYSESELEVILINLVNKYIK